MVLLKSCSVLITCTDHGSLCFWPPNKDKVEISAGKEVSSMASSPDSMLLVATGGKDNDLKLWDGNRPEAPVFQARNASTLSSSDLHGLLVVEYSR